MRRFSAPTILLGIAGLAIAAAGCDQAGSASNTVDVITWWSAKGESNALQALHGLFETTYPTENWKDDTVLGGSTAARATITEKMLAGQPPETFQANGGWDLLGWVLYNHHDDMDSKLEPIDDLAKGWKDAIPMPVLDTVSFGGHMYAVPLDIHRVNTLFYNVKIFADNGVAVPTTLDGLFSAAATFQAKGITPIALGTSDPWTLGILLFENLLVARAGGDYYRTFFLGQGNALAPEIRTAVDDLSKLLSYTNTKPAPQELTWSDAVDLVRNNQAAMTIMGDWTKGYLDSNGALPDQTYGEVVMPGTDGTFVFTTDTFGWPKGARNREGLTDLLQLFASEEGQDTFNPIKGSISARDDAHTLAYHDAVAKRTIADFLTAAPDATKLVPATAILAPQEFMTAINTALGDFAGNGPLKGNASVVLHTLDNWSDVLRASPLH